MTARKNLKKLIRARMQKTGESYTAARRHIIHREASFDVPPAARSHLPGSIPATTALRVLVSHAGLSGPDGKPLSEAMAFGIAGGIGIGVFQFYYEKEDFASFFLAGRHSWHDDLPYLQGALAEQLGLRVAVKEAGGAKAAEKHLRDALAGGAPCAAWVDSAALPHRAMPASQSGGGYHVITVYGIDDDEGIAWIGDCTDSPLKIALPALAAARARIKKYKSRVLSIEAPGKARQLDESALRGLVVSGLERCRAQLAKPAMKSAAKNFQLDAIAAWAERLHGSSAKDSWERVFTPGANLWRGLTWIYHSIEHHGTGGGLCRPHMADFLEEAGRALDDGALAASSKAYRKLGAAWSDLARAALPDEVPALRRARELLDERAELVHEGAAPEKIRAAWEALDELEATARESFPLDAPSCDALRASLKERALAIHAAEVAALASVEGVVS